MLITMFINLIDHVYYNCTVYVTKTVTKETIMILELEKI